MSIIKSGIGLYVAATLHLETEKGVWLNFRYQFWGVYGVSLWAYPQNIKHPKSGGKQIFWASRSHFRILGATVVKWRKFHNDDTQIWGATAQNIVARDLCLSCFNGLQDKQLSIKY